MEAVEGRSQLEILRDLYNSGFDVVRLAAQSHRTSDGTVDIDEGVMLFERARDTLYAAACATVKPQAVFHARRPQLATEYMRKARLGQTEQGSYVLTLLSPVAPQLAFHSDTELFPEEPFERRVVETLAKSVRLAVGAAARAATATSPDFRPFQEAVAGGVSANLCEGIAGLFSASEPTSVELRISWALKALPRHLMYEVLSMPNRLDGIKAGLAATAEDSFPPDYSEYYEYREEHWSKLGLKALDLIDALCHQYKIPLPERPEHYTPRGSFREVVAKIEEARQERNERNAAIIAKLSASPAPTQSP